MAELTGQPADFQLLRGAARVGRLILPNRINGPSCSGRPNGFRGDSSCLVAQRLPRSPQRQSEIYCAQRSRKQSIWGMMANLAMQGLGVGGIGARIRN